MNIYEKIEVFLIMALTFFAATTLAVITVWGIIQILAGI